jgi:hypothetical protein
MGVGDALSPCREIDIDGKSSSGHTHGPEGSLKLAQEPCCFRGSKAATALIPKHSP